MHRHTTSKKNTRTHTTNQPIPTFNSPHQIDGALGGRAGAPAAELAFSGANGLDRFTVASPLRRQRVKPEAKLTAVCAPLRPAEALVEPLERPVGAGEGAGALHGGLHAWGTACMGVRMRDCMHGREAAEY